MPELPDITVYIEALTARIQGRQLQRVLLKNPFLLRTAQPALAECTGRSVRELRRLGKRIAIGLSGDLWLVLHLMIAGRLHWYLREHRGRIRPALLHLEFDNGTLTLTEAGTKRRASLHVVAGEEGLREHDRGGLEVFEATLAEFQARLGLRNHTLKRALSDPALISGIGNAYSDEILHAAKLSPLLQTRQLDAAQWEQLYAATRDTLSAWTQRLRERAAEQFPEGVTAFHDDMAVHGRYGEPCPVCGSEVQRIRYAENETNYCPRCQTGGKLLADRSLSRLLKDDWPRSIDDLENERGKK
jgi:formamidopyrimidine-DNA glycosylase